MIYRKTGILRAVQLLLGHTKLYGHRRLAGRRLRPFLHVVVLFVMQVSDFHFDLPGELIARFPTEQRTASRLLCLEGESGRLVHGQFTDLLEKLNKGDLLVFNNTRVIPARLFGKKESGGKIEILVERVLNEREVLAHVRSSKSPKAGSKLVLEDGSKVEMLGREGALFHLGFPAETSVIKVLNHLGHMPLPPYIDREDVLSDRERYQTVYAEKEGAVAAPTAGLHFDDAFIEALREKGVDTAYVTLHVGAGTFQPVKVDKIEDHHMHSEYIEVEQAVVDNPILCFACINVACADVPCAKRDGTTRHQADKELEKVGPETQCFQGSHCCFL